MMYLFEFKDHQVSITSPHSVPKLNKAGAFLFNDTSRLEVRAERYFEAIDQDDNVLGVGTSFHVYPKKGRRVTVRRIKPPRTKFSAAEIEKARDKTKVTVVDQERHSGGPFEFGASFEDATLNKVIDSLDAIRALIPKQYRAKARCEIDSTSGYEGSHYAHITINYLRPETDKEVVTRLQDGLIRATLDERIDRQELAALQAKYPARDAA